MARRIPYCEVCKSSSNIREGYWCTCSTCKSSGNYYIKESYHKSEIEAKNSEIAVKDFEIQNLKSAMSQSKMIVKEEMENLGEKVKEEMKNLRENIVGQHLYPLLYTINI